MQIAHQQHRNLLFISAVPHQLHEEHTGRGEFGHVHGVHAIGVTADGGVAGYQFDVNRLPRFRVQAGGACGQRVA